MADDKIALSIEIEADRAQMSLGELEKGFAGLQETLKGQERVTDEGKAAFKRLSTQMAQTSAEIKNLELGFEGLDREQIASEFGGLAGGIGDVTASLVLMGGENETIEQMGASIEKAMAISMGIKGVMEGAAAANKLYTNSVRAKAVVEKVAAAGTWLLNTANKALNTTLKMNPIGLILIAITAVVGAIVYFKDAIMGLIDTALKPFQWIIDILIDGLQAMGIMASDEAIAQEEAAEKKIESYQKQAKELEKLRLAHERLSEKVIGDLEYELELLKAKGEDIAEAEWQIINEKKKAAKTAKKIAQDEYDNSKKLIDLRRAQNQEVTDEDIQALNALVDNVHDTRDAYIESKRDQSIFFANRKRLRKEDREKDAEEEKDASDKRREQRKKDAADQKKIDEKAAADAKLLAEKEAADAVILAAELIKTLDDLEAKAFEDKNLRAVAEKELAHTREKEALILKHGENAELLAALDAAQLVEMNALDDSIEQEAITKEAERVAAAKAITDAAAKDAAAEKQAQRDKDFALASAAIGALSALNKAATDTALLNAAGDEEKKEKIRKASFEREKKLNVAMALINGAQAVLAGFAQGGLPMAIVAGVTAAAQLAAILATTYQGGGSVKQVDNTAPVEPDGAGAGGAGAQINPVTNTSTILGNQQVYVTETDITSTQNNVSVIEESATF